MDSIKIPESITLAINAVKGFAKYLLIPTAAIIFLPDHWLEYIKLLELKNTIGLWIALVFLLSLSIIVVDVILMIIKVITDKRNVKKSKINRESTLLSLTATEKYLVKKLFDEDSAEFPFNDASVNKLERLAVVIRPTTSTGTFANFSYTLQTWVRNYINENPDFLMEDIHDE